MLHAAFLLLFMVVAAPLAGFVPLAALAGVLVVVAWNMAEKAEFLRQPQRERQRDTACIIHIAAQGVAGRPVVWTDAAHLEPA